MYTEAGGKPHSWDPKQQAKVSSCPSVDRHFLSFCYDIITTLEYTYACGFVGYLLFTLLLFLLIPKLFWESHNKLVCKETSPVSRSLYWGSAVISLFLVIIIMLGKFILVFFEFTMAHAYPSVLYNVLYKVTLTANLVVETFSLILFLVVSIIISRSSRGVPMPAAKFTTHVLFCCCCCFCCSSRCKSKGVQVLTLWAFMTVIYYHIMEAVALVFTLFINVPLTISYTLTYVSGVLFAIMLLSIILSSCRSTGRSRSTRAKCLCVVNVSAILLGFSFLTLAFVAFISLYPLLSGLNVKGPGIVSLKFSLLPSLSLSVAGWLIRKKLLKQDSNKVQQDNSANYGATARGYSLSDDVQGPEEEQTLL